MVVFDANFLIFFLDAKIKGGAVTDQRVDHLVATLQQNRDRIVVPTPALSDAGIAALSLEDLPVPPVQPQFEMELAPIEAISEDEPDSQE